MLKLKRLAIFSLISTVLLFLLILPALANGDSCTTSSDGSQTCVVIDPASSSGEGSSPSSPGTIDPVTVTIEPTPSTVIDKPDPEVKPAEGLPTVEEKPAEEAPDAVPEGTIIPTPVDEKPHIAEDSIGKDDGIRYFATGQPNQKAVTLSSFTGSTLGWVAGLTIIATFVGGVVYAMRARKKQK